MKNGKEREKYNERGAIQGASKVNAPNRAN